MTIPSGLTQQQITTIRNEQLKLKASYFNNASVALTITGIFIPLFSVSGNDMQVMQGLGKQRDDGIPVSPNTAMKAYGVIFIASLLFCIILAAIARRHANCLLEGLR